MKLLIELAALTRWIAMANLCTSNEQAPVSLRFPKIKLLNQAFGIDQTLG